MTSPKMMQKQTGVITIFITMMMLLLVTVLVVTAYSLSTMNLRAVGNVQAREEAIAASNLAIETIVDGGALFTDSPAATRSNIDINNDGTDDFVVDIAVPRCVRATRASSTTASSVTLPGMSSNSSWNTVWELDATATEATSGAEVRIQHGIRVLLSESRKNAVCS
jgi:Tfp pilus assembly protein PilX